MELFTILYESIKLLRKNGKLMAFIAMFSAVLSSCSVLLFKHNSFPSSFMPETGLITGRPGHLGDDSTRLLALQTAFILAISIISFLSSVSTILVSAVSYSSKTLSLKDLFSGIWTTWTRPLITSLYMSGLAIGYFLIVTMLAVPLLMYSSRVTLWLAVLLGITASILYLYLFVSWALAIVVSVVEGCYGMEALRKSAALVKGKRVLCFLLNVVILVIYEAYRMILGHKGLMNTTMYALFVMSVTSFAKIFLVVVYTVLYYHCKKHHGEEIELHESFLYQYSKLPTTQ
ncbi:UNVERIFIED_CONTAM: hypothetical protein Sangu_1572600 [Sesamum angustifolium]|uniref:Transmembrane protein n=1 Tax=Sesamum angustifolium TaxID=2727405 RepID=A0AAW2MTQ7_9LAMI